jgi:branched-chain amino acid transport system substrate-binding protein
MKKMNKVKLIIVLAICILGLNACDNLQTKDGIKIGVILPSTGKFAVIGEGEKKGIEMAIDSLKKIFPTTQIEVVFEDFASETKNAAAAANKLISVYKVDAIITSTTAAAEAVSPIVEKAHIIHFVISPDMDIVKKSSYNFRVYYNFNTEAEVVNSFVQKIKPSSVSFLASKYSSLQKLVDGKLEPEFKQAGINIIAKEYVEVTDKDFKTPILKIKKGSPAMLFLAPMTNQVDLYTNQLRDYEVTPSNDRILIGSFTFNWKPADFISTLEGYYIVTPVFQTYENGNLFVKEFYEKYKAKPSFDIAYAYDNTLILTELLISSKKDFNNFKESFNNLGTRQGASGNINFVGNNETNAEIIVTKVVNGKQIIQ